MRILFVALSKEIKGGGRYAEHVMRQALSERHKVKFLYLRQSGIMGMIPKRLQACILGYLPLLARMFYNLIFTSDNFVFADVVYAQPPAGKDATLTWNEMVIGRSSNRWLQWLALLPQRPLKALVSKHADFITNSNYAREIVQRTYGKDPSVIYPPVPTHLYQSLEAVRDNLVVTISALALTKNLGLIAEVGKMVPEAKFILVGFYHEAFAQILERIRAEFEALGLGDNFEYVASASDETKVKILTKAKVYFHPTFYEPFGIGIVEGMAAGCIPVVHDSGGPQEFVPHEWRYRGVEDAASKIRYALKSWNITVAAKFRALGLEFGEERFKQEILEFVEQKISRQTSK